MRSWWDVQVNERRVDTDAGARSTGRSVAHLFPRLPQKHPRVGAEIELLTWVTGTDAIASVTGQIHEWMRAAASAEGWSAIESTKGSPKYACPDGGTVTFEPGGQVEYSSPPHDHPRSLITQVQNVVGALRTSAAAHGLSLHSIGIDPTHSLADTPLQLTGDRYTRMDAYFRRISEAGARMMRQTAALQMSVDAGLDPGLTWQVLNRAAPVLTALFANSREYTGRDSGCASYRALQWRKLDTTRTGVWTEGGDAIGDYNAFALNACCINDESSYRPFADIPQEEVDDETAWPEHLSTLFPEVRPKGYYEVRCMDAIPMDYIAAPILIVSALARDAAMLHAVARLLPPASDSALYRAATEGMADPQMRTWAEALVELTEEACERAGEEFANAENVSAMRSWLQRSTSRSAALQDDFIRDNHVPDHALARFGK